VKSTNKNPLAEAHIEVYILIAVRSIFNCWAAGGTFIEYCKRLSRLCLVAAQSSHHSEFGLKSIEVGLSAHLRPFA
jgi:hypothetical protein